MRIVLLSSLLALPAAAADRGQLAQQLTEAEANLEAVTTSYARRIADAKAEVQRVRSSGERERVSAEQQVSAAQAAFADAYRVRPGRRGGARGRRLQMTTRDVTADLAARLAVPEVRGALVAKIKYDSEAYIAGLRAGDVILMFDGMPVVSSSDLESLAKRAARGRKLYVEVWRDRADVIVGLPAIDEPRVKRARARLERARDDLAAAEAMLVERSSSAEGTLADLRDQRTTKVANARAELEALRAQLVALNQRFGLKLSQVPKDVARYFQVSGGAYVRAVEAGSRAAETGLQNADIVVRFANTPVRDARHLTELIRATGSDESVRVEVLRSGESTALTTPGALDT